MIKAIVHSKMKILLVPKFLATKKLESRKVFHANTIHFKKVF